MRTRWFLKWWYLACTTMIVLAVFTMAICVNRHLSTHNDQLLVVADYARCVIYGALFAAIIPPAIWIIRQKR